MLVRMIAPIDGRTAHYTPTYSLTLDGPAVELDEREADRLLSDFPDAFERVRDAQTGTKTGAVRSGTTKRG